MRRTKSEIWDDKLDKIHALASEVSSQVEKYLGSDSNAAAEIGDIMCFCDNARAILRDELAVKMEAKSDDIRIY